MAASYAITSWALQFCSCIVRVGLMDSLFIVVVLKCYCDNCRQSIAPIWLTLSILTLTGHRVEFMVPNSSPMSQKKCHFMHFVGVLGSKVCHFVIMKRLTFPRRENLKCFNRYCIICCCCIVDSDMHACRQSGKNALSTIALSIPARVACKITAKPLSCSAIESMEIKGSWPDFGSLLYSFYSIWKNIIRTV